MCGICGVLSILNNTISLDEIVRQMNSALIHRGPDDEGYFFDENIAFGHRRLSIIDLSTGHQPISNEDESIWIVFNGEIYNFQTLRKQLEDAGHRFSTNTDTEVIVHCYEQYGEECVKYFRGMFAFAIWDKRHKKLMLARDRVGKKPLFYAEVDGKFLFASELQAFFKLPWIPREVDHQAIDLYLSYGYIPAPFTAFKGIKKLPIASYLVLQDGKIKVERYWNLEYLPKLTISEEDACEHTMELLKEAVKLRMISDVPLGAFLSGGVDSSAIVALMSQLSDKPVETFSIGFEESAYNELDYARMVAQKFNTNHHEFMVHPRALDILPKLVRHYGEPYADSSAIPTFYVSSETSKYVKIALNGDGGDENFAGYERYFAHRMAQIYQKIPTTIRKIIERGVFLLPGTASTRSNVSNLKRFCAFANMPIEKRYIAWMRFVNIDIKPGFYSPEFVANINILESERMVEQLFCQTQGLDIIDSAMSVDVNFCLPYDLMVKVDITSMINSLEARSPFLDHHLMEFSAKLPSSYKLHGRIHKYILKKALKGILPDEILTRRKRGFSIPIDSWFRGELKSLLYDTVFSSRALQRGYFNTNKLHQIAQEHDTGQKTHGSLLWALLMLEMWHKEFID